MSFRLFEVILEVLGIILVCSLMVFLLSTSEVNANEPLKTVPYHDDGIRTA